MDVNHTSEKLIHEILAMIVSKILSRVNNSMHVSLHQVSDNVNVFVASWGRWFRNINQADNVFVIEEFQKLDFSHDSLGINQIFESFRDFFNSNLSFNRVVQSGYDDTVGAMSNLLDVLVLIFNEEIGSRRLKLSQT